MESCKHNAYAVDFACYLAKLTGSRLTGTILEGSADGTGTLPALRKPTMIEKKGEKISSIDPVNKEICDFREACSNREVCAKVHRDRGIPIREILQESRFADLMVLDPDTSFRKIEHEFPGQFVRDVLAATECPVIISPYSFEGIDKVIFTYNGTESSVFAIKQFTYIIPAFKNKKAIVVSVLKYGEDTLFDQFKIKEWFSSHYQDVEFVLLRGDASDKLFNYLIDIKDAMVVLGAFSRGIISRFFKPSHASLLLRTLNLPFFIAHR